MKYLLYFFLFISVQEALAQNYFLKVTNPDVIGASDEAGHIDEIELDNFTFSILNNINIGSISSGGEAGKASSGPISLQFKAVKDAFEFFKALHTGGHFAEFKITARKTGNPSDFDYLIYTFKEVAVSNFTSNYIDGDDKIIYKIAVKVSTIKVEYYPTKNDGTRDDGQKTDMKWSFIKNTESEDI